MEDKSRTPAGVTDTTGATPPDTGAWDAEADEIAAGSAAGGARSARRTRWWVVGTALVLLATAAAAWVGLRLTTERATPRTLRYDLVSDSAIDLELDVTRPVGRTAVCRLRAEDNDHATLGLREITVPAAPERTTVVRARIRTTYRATNAVVDTCRLV